MYWSDFKRLVRRNSAYNAVICYYPPNTKFPHKMTILDYGMPRREGVAVTGWSEVDWYWSSQVCTCGWFNGEIPMIGSEGEFDKEGNTIVEPYRGALNALNHLLDYKCLRPTEELRRLMREYDVFLKRQWLVYG